MKQKAYSRKKDIDPAFSIIINEFKNIFEGINAQHTEPDYALNKMTGSEARSFKQFYEKDHSLDNLMDAANLITGELPIDQIRAISDTAKINPELIYTIIIDAADSLNIESREYYHKAFEVYSSTDRFNEFASKLTEEEKKHWQQDMTADITSLFIRLFIAGKEEIEEGIIQNIKEAISLDQLLAFNFSVMNQHCLIINKKSLQTLYKEAKDGDQKALIKLLQFDKTLFDHEWVRALMFRAMITGDDKFFVKIGYAIRTKPPAGKLKQAAIKYILTSCWCMGLYRLSNNELVELLESSGIEIYDDTESFRSFVNKEIKPLFPQYNQ